VQPSYPAEQRRLLSVKWKLDDALVGLFVTVLMWGPERTDCGSDLNRKRCYVWRQAEVELLVWNGRSVSSYRDRGPRIPKVRRKL
jgi:hypothetical protein